MADPFDDLSALRGLGKLADLPRPPGHLTDHLQSGVHGQPPASNTELAGSSSSAPGNPFANVPAKAAGLGREADAFDALVPRELATATARPGFAPAVADRVGSGSSLGSAAGFSPMRTAMQEQRGSNTSLHSSASPSTSGDLGPLGQGQQGWDGFTMNAAAVRTPSRSRLGPQPPLSDYGSQSSLSQEDSWGQLPAASLPATPAPQTAAFSQPGLGPSPLSTQRGTPALTTPPLPINPSGLYGSPAAVALQRNEPSLLSGSPLGSGLSAQQARSNSPIGAGFAAAHSTSTPAAALSQLPGTFQHPAQVQSQHVQAPGSSQAQPPAAFSGGSAWESFDAPARPAKPQPAAAAGSAGPSAPASAQARTSTAASSGSAATEARPVTVDGIADVQVDAWFSSADMNHDGRLAGAEAKSFFQQTGLSLPELSKIWSLVKAHAPAQGEGLTRAQFAMALRLVALAQSGQGLTDDLTTAAVDPKRWLALAGRPLPAPKLQQPASLPSADLAVFHARQSSYDESLCGDLSLLGNARDGAEAAGTAESIGDSPMETCFAKLAMAHPAPAVTMHAPASYATPSPGPAPIRTPNGVCDAPLGFEARLPPLHPKLSSRLCCLAAGCGSLFAGPSSNGGVLQWGRPEGNMRRPVDVEEQDRLDKEKLKSLREAADDMSKRWRAENEDVDAAPSHEVLIPDAKKVTCLHIDELSGLLWTGHEDGRVFAYRLGPKPGFSISGRAVHGWQAHKIGAVTAMCVTAWGELWTGSSRGSIRIWRSDGESTNTSGEYARPMRELRRVGGGKPHNGAIHYFAIPAGGQIIWSGSNKTLALWCAYSGNYVGYIGREKDPILEYSVSTPALSVSLSGGRRDGDPDDSHRGRIDSKRGLELDSAGRIMAKPHHMERERYTAEQEAWAQQSDKRTAEFFENLAVKSGVVAGHAGKAAKFIGKLGQRIARNLYTDLEPGTRAGQIAASKPDRDEPTEHAHEKMGHLTALIAGLDGHVWVAFKKGRVERYNAYGKLLWSKEMSAGVSSMCAVGSSIWAGLVDGRLKVWAASGQVREWRGHDAGIISIMPCGSRAYTLAADGSIKGWSSAIPSDYDQEARSAFEAEAGSVVKHELLEVMCLTWNVNEQKPDSGSAIFRNVDVLSSKASVAVVALQEIEMGGSSVAIAAAKDAILKSMQEKGNQRAQWWNNQMLAALSGGPASWMRVGLRQLSGMLVMVFARKHLQEYIGEVSTASVACGVLGVGGNKGAVAVSFSLYRRKVAVVCSHFAAHQGAVEQRNQNYASIVKNLTFERKPWFDIQASEEEERGHRKGERSVDVDEGLVDSDSETPTSEAAEPDLVQGEGMRDLEMLIWAGDFNYRVDTTYEDAVAKVQRDQLEDLLRKDQLRREMHAGRVFRHMREGQIAFRPTYKFDKNTPDPCGYDTSEKQRVPAWTDRIFYRGSGRGGAEDCEGSFPGTDPETDTARVNKVRKVEEISVKALAYNACLDVTESDHKPVWASLAADMPVTNQDKKRRICSHLLKAVAAKSTPATPSVELSASLVTLSQIDQKPGKLRITNTSGTPAVFTLCALHPEHKGSAALVCGLPPWLEAYPINGVLAAQACVEVTLAAFVNENVWTSKAYEAELRVRVDHELAAGGERAEPAAQDRRFKVVCLTAANAGFDYDH
ncbi:hypothetical protein WJX72_003678 [[Myrmecia] bisecta]|uniref:EH domain-containing protein n=1 Tax=[Myrmecia] bisecta TaxID=41462 RepID=A0AAW1P953_9CHLO